MKRFLLALCLSCPFCLPAQNKKLDSLYTALQKNPQQDTNRVNTLIRICYYEYTANPEKNKALAEEAYAIAKTLGYTTGIGMALRYTALYYWVKSDYDRAAEFAFKMLKVFEDAGDEAGMAKAYTLVGLIHEEWRNFDKAKEYHLKSLALNQKAGRTYDMGYNYNSLGALHSSFSKYDEAKQYYLKSLALRQKVNDEDGISQSYINLASILEENDSLSSAVDYYNKALGIARKLGNRNRISIISNGLASIYAEQGDYKKANKLQLEALAISKRMGNKRLIRSIYHDLLELERKQGNYKKALEYALIENAYQDSIFTREKSRQLAEMQTRYESEKKEQSIQLLERDNKIQGLWRNTLAGSLAVIIIAGFFYYHVQRVNARRNRELLQVQEALNKKLTEVDRMKSQFFASVSHEFRTPLTLILAPLEEKLSSANLSPSEKTSALLMKRSAMRLLELVNQLLDLSKLEAGKMKLHVSWGNPAEFVRIIVASFDSWAEQKKIRFEKHIADDLSGCWFDADKLEKIISNLLSNAFKFTPAGGTVTLSLTRKTTSDSKDLMMIRITDTGKGIPEDEIDLVFTPFYQARNSSGEGTGLGLPLIRELVKLFRGTLDLTSKPQKGSTITISLPVGRNDFATEDIVEDTAPVPSEARLVNTVHVDVEAEENETAAPSPDTVLVVEDNDDLRNFMISVLRSEFTVLTARDGEEGIHTALQTIPNLIISDLMMPKTDGMKLTEKIKADERTSHIPVILLTAKNEDQSRLQGFRTGADDYIAKPFSVEELKARITNLIVQRKRLAAKYKERIMVLASASPENSLDEKFLQKARSITEKNMDNFTFGVELLAEGIGLSRAQLHRKLKALTGLSPGEFIRDLRLQKAAALLKSRADNVARIGYAVGFNDQSYFAKCFRKEFGMSPTEYSAVEHATTDMKMTS